MVIKVPVESCRVIRDSVINTVKIPEVRTVIISRQICPNVLKVQTSERIVVTGQTNRVTVQEPPANIVKIPAHLTIGNLTIGGEVIDNLTSSSTSAALSANQGRVLDEKIAQFSQTFIPTSLGQTVFTLANAVRINVLACLKVNGLDYLQGIDFTLSGTTLTWLDNLFILDQNDTIKLNY